MKQCIKWIFFLTLILQVTGCEKFTDVDGPIDVNEENKVFENDALATAALTGIYTKVMTATSNFLNGGITIWSGLTSDELLLNGNNTNATEFFTNSISPSNSFIKSNLWLNAYSLLYQINACIIGVNGSKGLSELTKKQLLGESYFLRALIYFNLTNLFGDVPLILTTDYKVNAVAPRTAVQLVRSQIKEDLTNAVSLLNPEYPTSDRARVNRWAAQALFAKLSLYMGNWNDAITSSGQVINSGSYIMEQDLDKVFLYNSREVIFQLMPVSFGYNTTEGNMFVPFPSTSSGGIPVYSLSNYLLAAFEAGDKRLQKWVGTKSVGGTLYTFPYKYKQRSNFTSPVISEYYVVLRLTEQYLIRAEAKARMMDLHGAIEDLDMIRSRAGIPLISVTDPDIQQTALLEIIQSERQRELFSEWGNRWFDLKRTGQADPVLKNRKIGWQATDTLYPIPISEIEINKNLTQNDGYK